ncbi:hypothetical protein M9Y10_021841 [Tritrichomonas musculus]|uniref:Bromo domain-containing protein n=1 Tax=Tritrichomonas musculus TaxID=1915356 RepID=A0ABR2KRN5_9EUKA
MPLSLRRKQQCIEIVHKLLSKKISSLFAHPVDPILDGCPDYTKIIKQPMDLGTVERNLRNDSYQNFSAFRDDVELIWTNAITFNGKDELISIFADQLRKWFRHLIKGMSDDEKSDWISKYNSLTKDIEIYSNKLCSEKKPKSYTAQNHPTTGGKRPPGKYPSGKSPQGKYPSGKFPSKVPTKIDTMFTNPYGSDSSPPQSPPPKPKPQPKRAPRPKVTQTEMNEIHFKIMSLTNRETISKIIDLINQCEPQLGITEDSEIDLNELTQSAKVALKKFFKENPQLFQ